MSDDLSPAEQARAARWAAGWLLRHPDYGTVSVLGLLDRHAEAIDPPETVESLRAERDTAMIDAKEALKFRRFWLKACADLDAASDTIARLRATHTEAEAARGRCARED